MVIIRNLSKKQLKIAFCAAGIFAAMIILTLMPSFKYDSAGHKATTGQAAALKATNKSEQGVQPSVNISSSGNSSSSGNDLQGTSVSSSAGSSSQPGSTPPSPPITTYPVPEPEPLYPVDPIPKCQLYKYPGGVQPLSCPVCEGTGTADGFRYPCGCGYNPGSEIMCAVPY